MYIYIMYIVIHISTSKVIVFEMSVDCGFLICYFPYGFLIINGEQSLNYARFKHTPPNYAC